MAKSENKVNNDAENNAVPQECRRLGEFLVNEGLVTSNDLEKGFAEREKNGGFLGDILVKQGFIEQDDLISLIVKQAKVPHISLLDYQIGNDLLSLVPEEICRERYLLPIDKLGNILTIAMVNPFDIEALELVRKMCPDLHIKPILCDWGHYISVIRTLFSKGGEVSSSEVSANDFGLPDKDPSSSITVDRPDEKTAAPEIETPIPDPSDGAVPAGVTDERLRKVIQAALKEIKVMIEKNRAPAPDFSKLAAGMQKAIEQGMENIEKSKRQASGNAGALSDEQLPGAIDQISQAVSENISTAIAESMSRFEQRLMNLLNQAGGQPVTAAHESEEVTTNVHAFPGAERSAKTLDQLKAADVPGLSMRTDELVQEALEKENPIPGYSFSDYIGGTANETAVQFCKNLAINPSSEFSPFYIYGATGLGKSHLLNAIGNAFQQRSPDSRIGYVSAGVLAKKYAKALSDGSAESFHERYLNMDLLIIDDMQLLADKPDVQAEVLYIIDSFAHMDAPLFLGGTLPPDKLEGFNEGLSSRLSGGVVVGLKPPEMDARIEILRARVQNSNAAIPDEILKLLAARIQDDMRKMTGALRKLVAYAGIVNKEITPELASEVLSQLGIHAA